MKTIYYNLTSTGYIYDKGLAQRMAENFGLRTIQIDVSQCPYHLITDAPKVRAWLHELIKSHGLDLKDEAGIRAKLGVKADETGEGAPCPLTTNHQDGVSK